MSVKRFLKEYRDFLTNTVHISKQSSYCYITYLKNACKLPAMNNHLYLIANGKNSAEKIQYANELCDAIDQAYFDPYCPIKQKDLNNSHTAAHILFAFVSGLKWIKHKGVDVAFIQIFNKSSIVANFKSRLRTQDRIYQFGAFPTNLYCKLATKFKVRTVWNKLINETKFIYDASGNYFCFKDIDQVMIGNDNHAYFMKDGKVYTIFTLITQTGTYVELTAKKLRNLTLDHDKPVVEELEKFFLSKPIPEMRKLSNDILCFEKDYKLKFGNADGQKIISEYEKTYDPVMLGIDEAKLLDEFIEFLDQLSLTIMDGAQNSSKGKKTTMVATTAP